MNPFLNIAIRAATEAGKIILRNLNKLDSINIQSKGRNDFVSEVDFMAEQTIINILQSSYPEHDILGEESGSLAGTKKSAFQWIIDPLDGTTNYLHGFPMYAVSIAVQKRGVLQAGVVFDPLKEELFTAAIGEGAFLNQRRLRMSGCSKMSRALIGTGFPFKNLQALDRYIEMFRRIFPETAGVRRAGSAALDLAYLASGRLDGFWEMDLKPWDIAAGVLLIKEAGGVISDFNGTDEYLQSGNVVGGCLQIHPQLLDLVNGR